MMKTLLSFILLTFSCSLLSAQAFINELHYDNAGTDIDEGLEIAGPAGTDLSCYKVVFYNGSNGGVTDTLEMSGTIDDEGTGYGAVWFAHEGIQNGSPDALGLVYYCGGAPFNPVHFISYEGALVASGGPFDGMASEDIGVAQDNSTAVGNSLQLVGTGQALTDFLWTGPVTDSRGEINVGQSFGTAASPSVGWTSTSTQTVSEDVGSVFLQIDIAAADMNDTEILTTSILGDASVGFDFEITAMPTLFTGGSSASLMWELTILDDTDMEASETIEVTIMTVSNNATIINELAIVTIEDNDTPIQPLPEYDIADVNTEDADGVADSLEVECMLTGTVTTQNFRPQGQQFYMQDATGGINVFAFSETFDYTTTIGDNITVTGEIDQYNGLTEIIPTAITFNSSGSDPTPVNVSEINDDNEGLLVKYHFLTIIDTSEWLADGSAFNVHFLNLSNDTVIVRIDDDSELASVYPPNWGDLATEYIITGVVGQFDSSPPYTEVYQLFPRYESDIEFLTVATEVYDVTNFDISPNPVNDILTINPKQNIDQIEIYNQMGKLIFSASYRSNVNVEPLEAGIYYLRALSDETSEIKRFIKE